MNPKGFDWDLFADPLDNYFRHRWSYRVHSVEYVKVLSTQEETELCYFDRFTHVYYLIRTGGISGWNDKQYTFLVRHKSGYYVYLKAFYDSHRGDFIDNGCIYYSKSWASMWWQVLSKEERNNVKALPWYQSCERTRAALLALYGCRLRRLELRKQCARDVWQIITGMVWEKRFNN
jgi:hypothetical protein